MEEAKYVLNPDGTVQKVGYEIQGGIIMDGSEPFYNDWDIAFDYKWENSSWIKTRDVLAEEPSIIVIDEPISNVPPYPSVTRKAYVQTFDLNFRYNELKIILVIRHKNASNEALLEYDSLVTLNIDNNIELLDEVTDQMTPGFDLFYLKITRDGMNIPQVCRYFIGKADDEGYIDRQINLY